MAQRCYIVTSVKTTTETADEAPVRALEMKGLMQTAFESVTASHARAHTNKLVL